MFLNLWADKTFIYNNWDFIFFDRKQLDIQLPKFFKNNSDVDKLFVIIWPGNFSSSRIWVEVINILVYLWVLKNVFYLNKLEFFNKLWFENIYLFSGNKNKFIFLKDQKNYDIVSISDMNKKYLLEELFELNLEGFEMIKYFKILNDIEKLERNKLKEKELLTPYYIFEPAVSC